MRNLNADQLHAFVSVVEAGGFTSAARRLHLTQPAISLQIRELEARCGVKLIDRDARRPRPTPAGQDLYEAAKKILSEQSAALALMKRHRDNAVGRVRIGMSTTSLIHLAGPALRKARREMPALQIIVEIGTSRELAQAVDAGDIDLAIVTLPVIDTNLLVTPLVEDPLVAIFPAALPDVPSEITPAWLAELPFIADERPAILSEMTRKWFADGGVEPEAAMRVEHLAAMRGAVEAGLGVSVVPQMLVQDRPSTLAIRPLSPPVNRSIALIERARPANPALTLLKTYLQQSTPPPVPPASACAKA